MLTKSDVHNHLIRGGFAILAMEQLQASPVPFTGHAITVTNYSVNKTDSAISITKCDV